MKCKLILSIAACGASLALCPVLHAQDATPSPSPDTSGAAATPAAGPGGGGGRGGGRGFNFDPNTMLQRLTTALALTQDEQTQILPILQTEATTIQGIRADTTLSRQDMRSKMMDARSTANTAINAILTPDQQTKFTALQAQMRNRRGGGGGGGAPADSGASPAATTSGS